MKPIRKVKLTETNVWRKDFRKTPLRIAVCYPNTYKVGMCSLAVQILYHYLNTFDEVLAERCFYEGAGIRPLTIESNRPLLDFDVIAFSLQYEIDYVNAIRMLIDSGIPPSRKKREKDEKVPLVIAGGICAVENPKPLEEYIDVFFIGEAEVLLDKFVEVLLSERFHERKNKKRIKLELAGLEGIYVPGYSQSTVRRVYVKDLNKVSYPVRQVTPLEVPEDHMPVYGRAFLLEVSRGCPFMCRFCLLGYTFKPYRYHSFSNLMNIIKKGIRTTGTKKVVIISSAIGNYPYLKKLLEELIEGLSLTIAIPSMRIDLLDNDLAYLLRLGGQRTLTIAPEVASEDLMRIINKDLDLDKIYDNCKVALEAGIKQLKLYFLLGVPYEDVTHIRAIADMIHRILDIGYEGIHVVRLSINPLIPKPHTPFQWLSFPELKSLRTKMRELKKLIRDPRVSLAFLNPKWARVQVLLSRGNRDIGKLLLYVAKRGNSLSIWESLLKKPSLLRIVHEELDINEQLPWDFIDTGIPKSFLIKEYEKIHAFFA